MKLTGGRGESNGGSIFLEGSGSALHATACVFFDNHAVYGGSVRGYPGTSIRLYRSNVTNNTAENGGGGLYSNDGSLLVHHSLVARNTAGSRGGGIRQYRGRLGIYRSRILENTQGPADHAAWGGGGVSILDAAVVTVRCDRRVQDTRPASTKKRDARCL